MVLIMLFSVPVFTVGSYMDEPNSYSYGLELINAAGGPESKGGKSIFNHTVKM